jgi:hypothetical protein
LFLYLLVIRKISIHRVNQALLLKKDFLSIVTDGMAQQHCLLPWLANLHQFPKYLPQHLQGVMAHGRILKMFRTFHNIQNGANLQIHTLLLFLEEIHSTEGLFILSLSPIILIIFIFITEFFLRIIIVLY